MGERFNLHRFGLATKIALAAGLIGLLSIVALTFFIYRGSEAALIERDTVRLSSGVAVSASRLKARIEFARQDAVLLAKTPPALGVFRAIEGDGIDPLDGSTQQLWGDRMATIFTAMLDARPEYSQVRLIGFADEGRELVRVDRLPDGLIVRTPREALQQKNERPYMHASRSLSAGQIGLSTIDLNVEHGKIETPHRPVIRSITPVVSGNGRSYGIVAINVDMAKIFDIVGGERGKNVAFYVTNEAGDYLSHPDPAKTFGFQLGRRYRLQDDFPELKSFATGPAETYAGFVSGPHGRMLAALSKVRYDPADPAHFVIVGETLPANDLEANLAGVRSRAIAAAAVVLLFGLVAMVWLVRSFSRPLSEISARAAAVAEGERNADLGEIAARADEIGVLARSFERMVEKVEQREQDLRQSEARTNQVIEVMPEAIVVVDRNGKIARVNHRTTSIFGYEAEELLGQAVEKLIPERFRAAHPGFRQGYAAKPEIRPMGAERDLYGLRKDGSEVPIEIALAPMGDTDSGQVVVSVADITRRKAAQDELRDTNEKLTRSNMELMQFAYVASHDLQEPLRMVDSYMGLIERRYKGKLDADADEFIGFAVDGARRMKRLINELLTYSRVSNRPLNTKPLDMRMSVNDVLEVLHGQIEDCGAEIEVGPLPQIEADPVQIERLFTNLVGNALKFHGERAPHIAIAAEQKGRLWEFTISDNGIGIDPEFNQKIFEIFSRLHSREQYDGTGIGLAACKRIVELHGGTIWVEPAPEGGSIFHFTLPEHQT